MTVGAASSSLISSSRLRAGISREVRILVVGGGGGGGHGTVLGNPTYRSGAGGAGGFLEVSSFLVTLGIAYSVTIGGGGAAATTQNGGTGVGQGVNGTGSAFGTIVSPGGGGGGGSAFSANGNAPASWNSSFGVRGASGGGAGQQSNAFGIAAAGIPGLGNSGGNSFYSVTGPVYFVGGGGGAGGAGGAASASGHGAAGAGKESTINGVAYCTGGAVSSGAGAVNTGHGGGSGFTAAGASGGSGIVLLRFNATLGITIGIGLTYASSEIGPDRIITITAGTDTVTFS
jgi:hypothetical protein